MTITSKGHMKLSHQQWLDALNLIPNYEVYDFSLGRINIVPSVNETGVINAFRVVGIHTETGLEVQITLRMPDEMIPFLCESFNAMNRTINKLMESEDE